MIQINKSEMDSDVDSEMESDLNLQSNPCKELSLACINTKYLFTTKFPDHLGKMYARVLFLNCGNGNLTSLPEDLFFQLPNLKSFNCMFNSLTSLPTIPYYSRLKTIMCFNNRLTSLPALPLFLFVIDCSYNRLTMLPKLNPHLQSLFCGNNQLLDLPSSLKKCYWLQDLHCPQNNLTRFPCLPLSLQSFNYHGNPVLCDLLPCLVPFHVTGTLKKKIQTLHTFAHLYFSLRLRSAFHRWMWKSREKRIRAHYHPKILWQFVSSVEQKESQGVHDVEDLDHFLDKW